MSKSSTFKSIRLSQGIRTDIQLVMMAAWEKKQPAPCDLAALNKAAGDFLWNQSYGGLKAVIKKIPEKMLRFSGTIQVQIKDNVAQFAMSEARPHPFQDSYNRLVVAIYDEVPEPVEVYRKGQVAHENWNKERTDFQSEIITILNSVTTTGQLIDLWPEAENYLPAFAADPSKGINLPALRTSRLNTLLGIK